MFVHTVIMVIEPHMKQGRQHKLISTIFLATSVTKKLDHNTMSMPQTLAGMIPMHLRQMVKRLENGMESRKLQAVSTQ